MFVFNAPQSNGTARGSGKVPPRILVVEDEERLRHLMTRSLTQEGYLALGAADGLEALAILERGFETYDLVVTDIVMPRLGGIGLYQQMRRQGINVPTLFTSAGAMQDAETELPIDPRRSFLRKPRTLEELSQAVRWALEDAANQQR